MRLPLAEVYRSASQTIGADLVAPLLGAAVMYQRAAGYFSSSAFDVLRPAFTEFFTCGGRMQLVCSPHLSADDASALSIAVYDRKKAAQAGADIEVACGSFPASRLLSLLVARGCLSIKVALPKGVGGDRLYHEKISVVSDSDGQFVALAGSANESAGGLVRNFERVDVFCGWAEEGEGRRARIVRDQFRRLWANDTEKLEVVDLAEACRRQVWIVDDLASSGGARGSLGRPKAFRPVSFPETLVPPVDLELFAHQHEAIRRWAAHGPKGILEMATGSGKTVTALSIASRVFDRIGPGFAVIVIAPLIHLVDQWLQVATRFGLRPIRCAEGRGGWIAELSSAIVSLNGGQRPVLSVATTAVTLASRDFQEAIARIRRPVFVIADEVHNYSSQARLGSMPQNAALRLGLSATPERWKDPAGTAALVSYFGGVAFRYSLGDAIEDGVLTRYKYFPILVRFDPDELEAYGELTRLIGRFLRDDDEDAVVDSRLEALLMKRARLVASARNKLGALRQVLESYRSESHILVYCGDGNVFGPTPEDTLRQVEAVIALVGGVLNMRCASYTAETSPKRRQELLKDFETGFIQVLVAIRCLDEGVDVPSARVAIVLASSTNPRQFVQRRGRLLRRSPGKTRALIHDLFVTPSDVADLDSEWLNVARTLVRSQIHRAKEFADLAENGPTARAVLLPLVTRLDLLASWEGD